MQNVAVRLTQSLPSSGLPPVLLDEEVTTAVDESTPVDDDDDDDDDAEHETAPQSTPAYTFVPYILTAAHVVLPVPDPENVVLPPHVD